MPRLKWTPERIAELRRRYPNESTDDIATSFGTSAGNIMARAGIYGIKKSPEFKAASIPKRTEKQRETYHLRGRPAGETHWLSRLSDREVELVRELKETGMPAGEIAEKFEITKRYVYKLVNFDRRCSR